VVRLCVRLESQSKSTLGVAELGRLAGQQEHGYRRGYRLSPFREDAAASRKDGIPCP